MLQSIAGRSELNGNFMSSQAKFISSSANAGKAFDLETARQGQGLGLTSMHERVRLVNGTISIQSTPLGGTSIHERVPFAPK